MNLSICAVIAVRNEAAHLRRALAELDTQGIDAVVIDHGSEDDVTDVIAAYRHRIVSHQRRGFSGEFSLSEQLSWKQQAIAGLRHDWVVHQDADENLRHADSISTLRSAIEQADDDGHTAVDFNEFVFLPRPGSRGKPTDFLGMLHGYYLHRPGPSRLHRAWKRSARLEWGNSGGHRLTGPDLRLAPILHEMRHYIGMSEQHIQEKYETRRFNAGELAQGWHGNRVGLSRDQLRIPAGAKWMIPWRDGCERLRADLPVDRHYWHWAELAREGTDLASTTSGAIRASTS